MAEEVLIDTNGKSTRVSPVFKCIIIIITVRCVYLMLPEFNFEGFTLNVLNKQYCLYNYVLKLYILNN